MTEAEREGEVSDSSKADVAVLHYDGFKGFDLFISVVKGYFALCFQVSVDVFKGFPNEDSIVNYTLNQAYQDNVSVFASESSYTQTLIVYWDSHVTVHM